MKNNTKIFKENQVELRGTIQTGFTYSHKVNGKIFYIAFLTVKRKSGTEDTIPLMIDSEKINIREDYKGCYISVRGEYRSYNEYDGSRTHLHLFVFVNSFSIIKEIPLMDENKIFMTGYLCRLPNHRKTPFGRDITDLMVAVNYGYGRTSYIPCICWGKMAYEMEKLSVGAKIHLTGRIQSRIYLKNKGCLNEEEHTVWEVSANRIEYLNKED